MDASQTQEALRTIVEQLLKDDSTFRDAEISETNAVISFGKASGTPVDLRLTIVETIERVPVQEEEVIAPAVPVE